MSHTPAGARLIRPGDRVAFRAARGTVLDIAWVPTGFGGRELQAHVRWDNGASGWTPARGLQAAPSGGRGGLG